MKATFKGSDIKSFYDGDPEAIPEFNLPAIVVDQPNDNTDQGAIGQDDVIDEIVVKVIFNKKDDYDNNKVKEEGTTSRKIRDLVGKRNPATGSYGENTVKGAIRRYRTQGIVAVAPSFSVNYGILPRANGIVTAEGHVTFTIEYSIDVNEAL
ncbi:hypothetical protein ACWFRF_15460 [Nocardia sp. NPDC055165]